MLYVACAYFMVNLAACFAINKEMVLFIKYFVSEIILIR